MFLVFELRDDLSFGNTSRMFASVSTIYDLKDDHEISGQFCIAFNLARSSGLELTLTINTNDKTYESAGNYDQCVPYSSTLVKVCSVKNKGMSCCILQCLMISGAFSTRMIFCEKANSSISN